MQTREVVIVDAVRTPIGNLNGAFISIAAHKLGEIVIRALLDRNNVDANMISEVMMGQVLTGACGQNPARQASMNSGIPNNIPAFTINKVCGSGLKAVMLAAQSIMLGENDIVIAGGQESMTMTSHAAYVRTGVRMGDTNLVDMMIKDGLIDAFNNYHMGITAENVAKKYDISRSKQDEFSCNSQNKAESAQKSGKFVDEIIPVKIQSKKGEVIVEQDEFIKHGTTVEILSKLRPAFDKNGTVTAGNASGINDGAAALLLMSAELAKKLGKKPLVSIKSWGKSGVDPAIMGIAPIYAVEKALKNASWQHTQLDLIEANEAFASQSIAIDQEIGWDITKVNVNGGAIALGHPIGASGARILVTLLHEMKRRSVRKGIATLCIGGGMGVAMCVEAK
ncbi:Acetyl-CoA acetyltransferase [Rickettsiales bacterium Ac37b]|nr:Acetyl-CoA acetyltransferase [Rickettsiales bacterium Ac37b]